eukprot:gene14060-18862_t
MECALCQLPEQTLCQLFCDWLTITDISSLDCALCCDNPDRMYLLRIITESSILSPINSTDVDFSLHYWSWLLNRNIYVNALDFKNDEGLFMLEDLINRISDNEFDENYPENQNLNVTIMNGQFSIVDSIIKLNHVKSLRLANSWVEINTFLLKLSSYCTNLKTLSLNIYNTVSSSGLALMLKANSHSLANLTLVNISQEVETVLSQQPLLFSNITELELHKEIIFEDHLWCNMSACLNNLTSLSLSCASATTWRKSLLNFKMLVFLVIVFKEMEENDNLCGLFPHSLVELDLTWRFQSNNVQQLQNLLSFHQLINLKKLTVNSLYNEYVVEGGDNHLSLLIPPSLTTIDLKYVNLHFSNNNIIQMLSVKLLNLTIAHLPFPVSLTQLNMECCGEVDDDIIISIFTRNMFSNLTSLNLSNNSNIHSEGFSSLLPHTLTYLTLLHSGFTSMGISEIITFSKMKNSILNVDWY